MSRGLGVRQREILATLEAQDCFYLVDLLPENYKHSEYTSLHRAFMKLLQTGLVDEVRYLFGPKKVLVCRKGYKPNDRPSYR